MWSVKYSITGICMTMFWFLKKSLFFSSHQIQQQALLVLQENQVLLDQLEAQHGKAKASTSRHQAEGTTTNPKQGRLCFSFFSYVKLITNNYRNKSNKTVFML